MTYKHGWRNEERQVLKDMRERQGQTKVNDNEGQAWQRNFF